MLRCSKVILLGLFFYTLSIAANAAVTLVVDGKPYEVKESEMPDCTSNADLGAMKYVLKSAYTNGFSFAQAACKASCSQSGRTDCDSYCATDQEQVVAIKKKALAVLFSTIRRYPPFYKNDFCAQGRAYCEDQCTGVGVVDEKSCVIQCNQYESYFKK